MANISERVQRTIDNKNMKIEQLKAENATAMSALTALQEVQGFLPQTVSSEVRTGIAWLTAGGAGALTEAFGLADPWIPAGMAVLGVGAQFLPDIGPDAAEAAAAMADGAGAVLAFTFSKSAVRGAMDWILGTDAAKASKAA